MEKLEECLEKLPEKPDIYYRKTKNEYEYEKLFSVTHVKSSVNNFTDNYKFNDIEKMKSKEYFEKIKSILITFFKEKKTNIKLKMVLVCETKKKTIK